MAFDEAAARARDLDEAFDALLAGTPLPASPLEADMLPTLQRLRNLSQSTPDPAFVRGLESTLTSQHGGGSMAVTPTAPGSTGPARVASRPLPWDEPSWRLQARRWWQPVALVACLLGIIVLGIALAARDEEPRRTLPAAQPASPASGPRMVLLVMDVSGSMSYDPQGGTSKIDQAKAAARATLAGLEPGAWFGLLVFNDAQRWVVPLAELGPADQRQEAEQAIDAIVAEGGTEIYPALSVGLDALATVPAGERHLVLLTDGKSRTGTRESYQRLIESAGSGVTVSTVAIGADADLELTRFLAEIGGGQYQFAASGDDIPIALAAILGLPIATPVA